MRRHFSGRGKIWFYALVGVALILRLALYAHICKTDPEIFIDMDGRIYLQDAQAMWDFWQNPAQGLTSGYLRTPGYPVFLAVLLHVLGLTISQVILVQILMNFVTAFVVARIAARLDPRWVPLSSLIVLMDVPLMVYSEMILTESLFVLILALFILFFFDYLKSSSPRPLVLAVLFLVLGIYIRPAAYYLPWVVAGFLAVRGLSRRRTFKDFKKGLVPALVVLSLSFSLCLPWQYRNYERYGDARMSSIADITVKYYSLIGSYSARTETALKGMPAIVYYPYAFIRNARELMTTPGGTKYFNSPAWRSGGKGFGYLVLVFWLPGFFMGLTIGRADERYRFLIGLFLYFLVVTVVATGWTTTSRFRIAMLPAIAIIASAGWLKFKILWNRYRIKNP